MAIKAVEDTKQVFLTFESLLGREQIKLALQKLGQKQLNLTLLLVGEGGLGKYSLARAFSEILLCNSIQTSDTAMHFFACHNCSGCRYLQAKTHPDYQELRCKEPGKQLTMAEIRNFIDSETHVKAVLANRRVFVIDMEAISLAGQNLLLKTLESGASTNFYILLANSQNSVLPTIRSRSITYLLPHLSDEDMLSFWAGLPAKMTANKSKKDMLALAQGNVGFLQKLLADEEFVHYYDALLDLFKQLLTANLSQLLSDIYTELTSYKDKSKLVYLRQIWTFLLYQKSKEDQHFVAAFQAWERCMTRLQANGSFELQMQAFLIEFSNVL